MACCLAHCSILTLSPPPAQPLLPSYIFPACPSLPSSPAQDSNKAMQHILTNPASFIIVNIIMLITLSPWMHSMVPPTVRWLLIADLQGYSKSLVYKRAVHNSNWI
ncbi:uncharacterized protein EV420DRAFT_1636634 [Desarmillaria tabescens]|uniref:Uncharacterized protein n=1 Tax=Armillaria tabescens TaxID=1929756 RepID=A0AA39U325_ARMTA|nr:uncharacterized protein EV420DRAFT_1636634 [Desarmillaria tabescens]KAK0466050.1 hypothetical protein EV420DRAFT_1636634 [Desarmillaria tabescens]